METATELYVTYESHKAPHTHFLRKVGPNYLQHDALHGEMVPLPARKVLYVTVSWVCGDRSPCREPPAHQELEVTPALTEDPTSGAVWGFGGHRSGTSVGMPRGPAISPPHHYPTTDVFYVSVPEDSF